MNLKAKTILHVDDDADDRDLLKEIMEHVAPNVQVLFAENGLQAMELLNATKKNMSLPSLIILDLNMPYLNGKETLQLIQADPSLKAIPLVIFSSGDNPADRTLFNNEGIVYYKKPAELSVMRDIVLSMTDLCA